jgi:hypothetical protein
MASITEIGKKNPKIHMKAPKPLNSQINPGEKATWEVSQYLTSCYTTEP